MRWITLLLLGLLLMVQYPLWWGRGGMLKVRELEQQVEQQHSVNAALRERNEQLEGEVRDLMKGQQAVEERPRAIAGCGMYHGIHGFVEDDDVVVLINDIQVYIFWSMGFFDGKHGFQYQFVAGIDLVLAPE